MSSELKIFAPEILGRCHIQNGGMIENPIEWIDRVKLIVIDFDADHDMCLEISDNLKPKDQAQEIADSINGKNVTVAQLEELGFYHDIPKELQ